MGPNAMPSSGQYAADGFHVGFQFVNVVPAEFALAIFDLIDHVD